MHTGYSVMCKKKQYAVSIVLKWTQDDLCKTTISTSVLETKATQKNVPVLPTRIKMLPSSGSILPQKMDRFHSSNYILSINTSHLFTSQGQTAKHCGKGGIKWHK